MKESGSYPMGAEFDSSAPYNQVSVPEKELEVTISLTISKTVTIKVDDYDTVVEEDDGVKYEVTDYSECDLKRAVENQVTMPHELSNFVQTMFKEDLDLKAAGMCKYLKDACKDSEGWTVDDFEVVPE